eukprot:Mycagemm_TRINITY_DN10370_c2_g6::TRINITY_DN10370_c2_g6_i1::g.1108::m.1108 type:complete len:198 gc:universal TRINITY_DN10370_c2_g6_i1:1173-1766(+)
MRAGRAPRMVHTPLPLAVFLVPNRQHVNQAITTREDVATDEVHASRVQGISRHESQRVCLSCRRKEAFKVLLLPGLCVMVEPPRVAQRALRVAPTTVDHQDGRLTREVDDAGGMEGAALLLVILVNCLPAHCGCRKRRAEADLLLKVRRSRFLEIVPCILGPDMQLDALASTALYKFCVQLRELCGGFLLCKILIHR